MTITGLPQELHSKNFVERLSTCGFARSGVEVRIFDDQEHELPTGKWARSSRARLRDGRLLENPDATANTLRGGWLHTGDLGGWTPRLPHHQGPLEGHDHLGGSKHLPREIEEVLLRHPAVAECSVVGRPTPNGAKRSSPL